MFSFLTRLLLLLQNIPKLVIASALLLSILSVIPIAKIKWELSLYDLLPPNNPTLVTESAVQEKIAWRSLIVLAESPDSALNADFMRELSNELEESFEVDFVDYLTESDFYREHGLLYINASDLELVHSRIKRLVDTQKEKMNPFLVQLVDTEEEAKENFTIDDIEQKYLHKLKDFRGNKEGTIRVMEIFPAKSNADLQDMRKFYYTVKKSAEKFAKGNDIKILYGGSVYDFISNSGTLLSEIRLTALIFAGILLLLFIAVCIRIPAISIITAISLSMAVLWTFASAALLFERINIFTLLLCFIIPGIGSRNAAYLFARYTKEQKKGLSVQMALESTILGIGVPFMVSAFVGASVLFCLAAVPLQGIKELGITGGLGVLFNFIVVSAVMPAFLIVLQKKRQFKLYARKRYKRLDFSPGQFNVSKVFIIVVFAFSALLITRGIFPKMEYNFSKIDFPKPSENTSNILREINEYYEDPVIVLFPNSESADYITNSYPQMNWVTYASLLPKEQDKKFRILKEIHNLLTPDMIQSLRGSDSINAQRIISNWNINPLGTKDLPNSYKRKFHGKDGSIGEFGFIFPIGDFDDGLKCRSLTRQIYDISLPDSSALQATGLPIIKAELLNLTLPYLHKSVFTGLALIFLWLFLFQYNANRVLLILIPPAFGFLWFFGIMNLFSMPLNAFSIFSIPFLISVSIDGSMFLWHSYSEEGTGSMRFVIRQNQPILSVSYLIPFLAFLCLSFSSHPGLKSLGILTIIGLISLFAAHITVFPIVAHFIEKRRYRNGFNENFEKK